MKPVLILTTCPTQTSANKIATSLLKKHLAACIQITGPVKSHYRWKSKLCSARELQLWIKTTAKHLNAVSREICLIHPYEVPEILSISVNKGLIKYLKWIEQETSKTSSRS